MIKNINIFRTERFVEIQIFILIFILPFIFLRSNFDSFTAIKLLVVNLSLFFILIYLLYLNFSKLSFFSNIAYLYLDKIDLLIFLLISYTSLTIFWAKSFFIAISYNYLLLVGIVIYYLITINFSKINIEKISLLILLVGTLFNLYIIVDYFHFSFIYNFSFFAKSSKNFLSASIGNPNFAGNFLLFPLSFSFILFKRKILYLILISLNLFTIFITTSRGAILSAIFICLFSMYLYLIWRRNFSKKSYIYIIIFFGVFLVFSLLGLFYITSSEFSDFLYKIIIKFDYSAAYRIALQSMGWLGILKSPIIGNGFGDFAYNSLYYQYKFVHIGHNLYKFPGAGIPLHVHNVFIELFSDLGLIGIIIIVSIFYLFFYLILKMLKTYKDKIVEPDIFIFIGSSSAVLGFLVHSFFSFPFYLPANFVFFVLSFSISSWYIKRFSFQLKYKFNLLKNLNHKIIFMALYVFIFCSIVFATSINFNYYFSNFYGSIAFLEGKMYSKTKEEKFLHKYLNNLEKSVKIVNYYPYYKVGLSLIREDRLYRKKYEEALFIAKKMLKIYRRPYLLMEIGYLYEHSNKYPIAIFYLEEAMKFSYFSPKRDVADIAHELGNCYFKMGKIDKAIFWTEKALELNPSTVEKRVRAVFNLSIYYYYKKDYSKTLDLLNDAEILIEKQIKQMNEKDKKSKSKEFYLKTLEEIREFRKKLKNKLKK